MFCECFFCLCASGRLGKMAGVTFRWRRCVRGCVIDERRVGRGLRDVTVAILWLMVYCVSFRGSLYVFISSPLYVALCDGVRVIR